MLDAAFAGIFGFLGLLLLIYVIFNMPALLIILAIPLVLLFFFNL